MNQLPTEGPQQEAQRPEVNRREVLRREGTAMPMLSFWHIRSGTGRNAIFNASSVFPYTSLLEQALVAKDASPRGSSIADIAEFARDEQISAPSPTKTVPFVFAREIDAIQRQEAAARRRGESPSSTYEMYRAFMEGSDLDVRVDEAPENMRAWAEHLVDSFAPTPKERAKVQEVTTESGQTMWTVPLGDVIHMIPREMIALSGGIGTGNELKNLFVQVTYRQFADSGIPACDWKLVARSQSHYRGLDELRDLPLLSVGISPKASRLSPEQRALDSRMGRKVNSYDQLEGDMDSNIASLPQGAQEDLRTLPHLNGLTTASHGLVTFPDRTFPPQITQEADGSSHYTINGVTQTFTSLTAEQFTVLDSPITFGQDFGTASPVNTLLEGARTIRKALRYNGLAEGSDTERAKALLRSPDIRNALATEETDWWRHDLSREMLTAAWFAPNEIIQMGAEGQFNFAQYFPRWRYLEGIRDQLPTKSDIGEKIHAYQQAGKVVIDNPTSITQGLMHGEIRSMSSLMGALGTQREERTEAGLYVQGGWKFIADRIRKAFPIDPEITTRTNDLELVFWLFESKA